MKILFATTNKAKVKYYTTRLKEKGIDFVTLEDMGITVDVEHKEIFDFIYASIEKLSVSKVMSL